MNTTLPLQTPFNVVMVHLTCCARNFIYLEGWNAIISGSDFATHGLQMSINSKQGKFIPNEKALKILSWICQAGLSFLQHVRNNRKGFWNKEAICCR